MAIGGQQPNRIELRIREGNPQHTPLPEPVLDRGPPRPQRRPRAT